MRKRSASFELAFCNRENANNAGPKPGSPGRQALYAYLIGKPYDVSALPALAQAFEAFKRDPSLPVPAVPFQMLTALELTPAHWVEIAETAGWQMLRQNLNTFAPRRVRGRGFCRAPGTASARPG